MARGRLGREGSTEAAGVTCGACGRENPAGNRFCGGCGKPVERSCPSCQRANPPDNAFCGGCGQSLAEGGPVEAAGSRKVVSILFADLVGSTALHERLDPELARRFMERYYAAAREAVESHGGTVTQLLGDGVKAVFGIPRVAEDDAIRAVRAAVAMQEAFRALAVEQRDAIGETGLRLAVNTGEVVAREATEIIGDPVNVAARLQEQGRDGDVVVGESTQRLVSTLVTLELLGSFALKGRAQAVKAYRVVSLDRPAGASTAPFVGREDEIARLSAAYEAAVEKPAAALAVLVGSPGLGKSRLMAEIARQLAGSATVIEAHCDAAGGATFAPLADAFRERLGIESGAALDSLRESVGAALPDDEPDPDRIAVGVAALLAGSPGSPEETFFVVRRLLAALARTTPVVLVIDDAQWAEPLLLDLVEHLVQWGKGTPLFVLVGGRPELRELRSSLLMAGGLVREVVTLEGLDAAAATRLAANVIGANDLPPAVAAKVLSASEGNPLFVGELVRMLVEEGALVKEGDRWVTGAGLAKLEMPPTIHALLAARIERLGAEERTVLEHAAVVGRHFSRSTVAALFRDGARNLDVRLEALRRSELIERDAGWLLGEPVLRFHHVLIRDAAYRRLLKGTRAELHARLADWMEARVGGAAEHDEMVGRHLEQAHALLGELGPVDETGKRLGERAARRLAAAGRRALEGDDLPVAGSLLGRAIACLDAGDAGRGDLALDWCEALLSAGDVGAAASALDQLVRLGAGSERLRAWHTCFEAHRTVLTDPEGLQAAADAVSAAAGQLAAQGDLAGEAKAHSVHAQVLARLGRVGACETALDRALAAARRAGDRRRANAVLAGAPLAALWGPSPVTRASGRCLDVVRVLRITQGAPAVEAVALNCQGVLEALRGRADAGRRMIASARKMVEELGIAHRLHEADVFAARVEAMEGDAAAAEQLLRGAYDGLRDLGLGIDAAQAAALLARVVLVQDRIDEAEQLSHESEALAGDDLKAAIAWRCVRAETLAKRGDHAAAVELGKAAVELASATDALLDHADARMALATALRAASRDRDADEEERRAHDLWKEKGATLLLEQAVPAMPEGDANAPLASVTGETSSPRRVRPNAATAQIERVNTALAAGDLSACRACFHERYEDVDHPSGSQYGRDGMIQSLERLFRSHDPFFRSDPVATLGELFVLTRRHWGAGGAAGRRYDVGPYDNEVFQIFEAGPDRLLRRSEAYAIDRLAEAIVRLYSWRAELLPAGPARERAEAAARTVATIVGLQGADAMSERMSAGFEFVDHRKLGFESFQGIEAGRKFLRAMFETTDRLSVRIDDALDLSEDGFVLHWILAGTMQGGGSFERDLLFLCRLGDDGLATHVEYFDVEREADAIARFEALTANARQGAARPRRIRPNAATACQARFDAALARRDFATLRACFHDDQQGIDHPTGSTYGADGAVESVRRLFRSRDPYYRTEPLATLGASLLLTHRHSGASGTATRRYDVGPHESDAIMLIEVGEKGTVTRSEIFAPEHLGEAIVRLHRRYAELEADGPGGARAAATARAIAAVTSNPIDADRWLASLTPGFELIDHRVLGLGALRRDGIRDMLRAWLDLEDFTIRVDDVLGLTPDAYFFRSTTLGTSRQSGGAFEREILGVWEIGPNGRFASFQVFGPDQDAEAFARFDGLAGTSGATGDWVRKADPEDSPFGNEAVRALRSLTDRFNAHDWDGLEARISASFVFDDRRRLTRSTAVGKDNLPQYRLLFDLPESRFRDTLLGTRGERWSLHRVEFEGRVAGGGGPLAFEDHLVVVEADAAGNLATLLLFNLDELAAAYAELDARFAAGEGAKHARRFASYKSFVEGVERRDWEAVARSLSPDLVGRDHRLVGWGTLRGPEAFVAAARSVIDLAPDARLIFDHLRTSPGGNLGQARWCGTREGGEFESAFLSVSEIDADGRMVANDFYDLRHLDRALARFDEIRAKAPTDPLAAAAKPNRAMRLFERYESDVTGSLETSLTYDRDTVRKLMAPGARFEDRRRLFRIEGGLDLMMASLRERIGSGLRVERKGLIATAGDRVAVERVLWAGGPPGGRVEIEILRLVEVDEAGRGVALLLFDSEDAREALREAWARWSAIEPAAAELTGMLSRLGAALNSREPARCREVLAEDLVVEDHRRTGMGRLEGVEAYLASLDAIRDLTPEIRVEGGWHWPAWSARGAIVPGRVSGTLIDGGRFENFYLILFLVSEGRVTRLEMFEAEDLDAALARFREVQA